MSQERDSLETQRALLEALLADAGIGEAAPRYQSRERPARIPLSRSQELLWWVHHTAPETAAYTLRWVTRVRGALDVQALCESLAAVSIRHEILRATFPQVDGEPTIVIGGEPMACDVVDLRDEPRKLADAAVAEAVRQAGIRPWRMPSDRPHAALYRVTGDESVLLVRSHHMYSDGWSQGVFFADLAAEYVARVEGSGPPRPALAVQYVDWVLEEREREASAAYARSLAYWTERLRGANPTIELPSDRPRTGAIENAGARETIVLPTDLVGRVRALNRRGGFTTFMTLLAAFKAVLARYTGQEDLSVLTPIANRDHTALSSVIGYFANSVVMRTQVHAGTPFRDLLEQVKHASLEAQEHQGVAYGHVLDELPDARASAVTPFSQVMFAVQNVPRTDRALAGLTLTSEPVEDAAVKFDLMLSCTEVDDGIRVAAMYRPALFDAETIRAFLAHFRRLLEAVTLDDSLLVGQIPLMDAVEERRVRAFGEGPAATPSERTLAEMLRAQARRTPDAIAVTFDGESLTYAALRTRVRALAARLHTLGVARESRVGVCVERSIEMMVALLAVIDAGAAYVPLDPEYPRERLAYMLGDSGAHVVLASETTRDALPPFDGIIIDAADAGDAAGGEEAPIGGAADLAYVIYTSGSTGRPKGVMVEQHSVVNYLDWMRRRYPLGVGDTVLQKAPVSFDASVWELFLPLVSGARLVLARPGGQQDAEYLATLVRDERISIVQLVPSQARMLLELPEFGGAARGVRRIFLGGEAAPPDIVSRLAAAAPQACITNLYGPTEATVYCSAWDAPPAPSPEAIVPIGGPIAATGLYVVSSAGLLQPIGVPGELLVAGEGVARGYHARPDLTSAAFVASPIDDRRRAYRTGDIARWRRDGVLEYLGRRDEQVKLRGFRIELGEIERALVGHTAVRSAAVVVREDVAGDPRLVAYVVPADGCVVAAGELRAHLRESLPEHMVPASIVEIGALPLSANGKLDRKALPRPDTTHGEAFVAPRTPEEAAVARVWEAVLRVERVGALDNFFDLGGHSLLAMRALGRLEHELGVRIGFSAFVAAPVVASVAEFLRAARTDARGTTIFPSHVPATGAPLTFQQELIWSLDAEGGDALVAYNVGELLRVAGPLDVDRLGRAIDAIVARHDALRIRMVDAPAGTLQRVLADQHVAVNLLPMEPGATEDAAVAALREVARRPFDLRAEPPIRVHVVRANAALHFVLIDIHHLVVDGWSKALLLEELGALYGAESGGASGALPSVGVQYPAYAAWQRASQLEHTDVEFWQRMLTGAPAALALPTDRPRPAAPSFEGGRHVRVVPQTVVEAIERIGNAHGATPFMTILAAFTALVARWSGETDIVVGTPTAGRGDPALDRTVGFLASTLPLRLDLSDDPSFVELLRRARDCAASAFDHQASAPAVLWSHNAGPAALPQLLFSYQADEAAEVVLPGMDVQRLELRRGKSKVDLALYATRLPTGLRIAIEYRSELFDESTIERVAVRLETLLRSVADEPARRVGDLPVLGASERALLDEWNATDAIWPVGDTTLSALIRAQVQRTPDAIAVQAGDATLTFQQLSERATALAARLGREGVGRNALVGVCIDRSLELAVALVAVLEAGGAYVPLDPEYPAARLRFMAEDAGFGVLLTRDHLRDRVDAGASVRVLCVDDTTAAPVLEADRDAEAGARPDDLAYVIYTSGSTGTPKGARNTHRGIVNRLLWMQREYRLAPADAVLQKTPISFDVSVWELFWPLITGARLVMAEPGGHRDAEYLAREIVSRRISVAHFVPSMLRIFLTEPGAAACDSLRDVMCSGEALAYDLQQAFFATLPSVRLHNLYGPTEAAVDVSYWQCVRDDARGVVPIGRPVANTQLYVLDERMRPVPIGVEGELYIGGVQVGAGYHNRPDLSAERFIPDPFRANTAPQARLYRTGDRARWRADGVLEYLGRRDGQIKLRGFRIETGEIEAALAAHPDVSACAVVVRGEGPDAQLVGYCVMRGDARVGDDELRAWVADRLPDHMVPAAFARMRALPVTANGKLDRRALAEMTVRVEGATRGAEPTNETEVALMALWRDLLAVEHLGTDSNFFALGGHSLLAMRMLGSVQRQWGVRVPIRQFFARPTVQGLAQLVTAARGDRAPSGAPETNHDPDIGTQGVEDAAEPLAPAQELLWMLERAAPGTAAYHVHDAVRATGPLDVGALQVALDALARRHEALRCVIVDDGGGPRQRVAPPAPVALDQISVEHLPADVREQGAQAALRDFVRAPFDLANGPLCRARVIRIAPEESLVVLVVHHIVTDGWSQGLLRRELSELYSAAVLKREPVLEPVSMRFLDAVRSQRERTEGARGAAALEHWRTMLDGALGTLELPGKDAGHHAPTFTGASVTRAFGRDFVARVDELAKRCDATRFMVLLAALQTVLHRYTDAADVLIGAPVAGRDDPRSSGVVAYLANTIVLRGRFAEDPTFLDLVAQAREACLDAYEHQDVPFDRLAAALGRDAATAPLVQVLFALQNMEPAELRLEGASTLPIRAAVGAAKFDLTLSMTECDGALAATLVHRSGAISSAAAARLLGHLEVLTDAAARTPETRASALPLLTAAEAGAQREWNESDVSPAPAPTLVELLAQQVARTPSAIAVEDERTTLTFAALDRRANQLANLLQRRGIGPDSVVGVCIDRSVPMIVAMLGVLKAGGAYVPLDPEYPAERLALMVEDSALTLVLTTHALRSHVEETCLAASRAEVLSLDQIAAELDRAPAGAPEHGATPESLAYVIFTSGSTGRPKGVMIPHAGVVNFVGWARTALLCDERDAVLQKAPVSFDASVLELFLPLASGARLVLAPPDAHRDPDLLLDAVRRRGITTIQFVPSLLGALVDVPGFAAAFAGVRTLVCGGEALPAELARRVAGLLPNAAIVNLYGPTETTVYSAIQRWSDGAPSDGGIVAIGRPIANTRIHVLDANGAPVPRGVRGEICIGGAGVARGYIGRPDLTAERFIADTISPAAGGVLYRTGDIGCIDDAGVLYYLGRSDHQVKLRGFRVELSEIESALLMTGEVTHAAALVHEDGAGQHLVAFYAPRPGSHASAPALLARLRDRLPSYMVPEALTPLAQLPLSPSGKVDRRALPAIALSAPERRFTPPASPTEVTVAAIWSGLLGTDTIGRDDDFFAMGGNSLLAIRMISRVRDALGAAPTMRSIFDAPTLSAFAARLVDPNDPLASMLDELASMSDEEAERLLAEARDV